jgi:hypothetical protein
MKSPLNNNIRKLLFFFLHQNLTSLFVPTSSIIGKQCCGGMPAIAKIIILHSILIDKK